MARGISSVLPLPVMPCRRKDEIRGGGFERGPGNGLIEVSSRPSSEPERKRGARPPGPLGTAVVVLDPPHTPPGVSFSTVPHRCRPARLLGRAAIPPPLSVCKYYARVSASATNAAALKQRRLLQHRRHSRRPALTPAGTTAFSTCPSRTSASPPSIRVSFSRDQSERIISSTRPP